MAQQQNQSKDNIADTIDKVDTRNGLKIFLIGLDYKNIGQLRSEIANMDNHIDRLNTLLSKLENSQDITTIQEQIKTLEAERQKINDIVKANESKFSLFGWFVKLFNK
jgi:predicted nuclease with TOPRIM domain